MLPDGLTPDGVALLKSAATYGLKVDVINIMAMDYGNNAAPNGATMMGDYAISAAKAVYAQGLQAGLTQFTVGITPMVIISHRLFIFKDRDKRCHY